MVYKSLNYEVHKQKESYEVRDSDTQVTRSLHPSLSEAITEINRLEQEDDMELQYMFFDEY